jgi:hypothetical protein
VHYDYFIASRYRNKDAVLELAHRIRESGKSAYCFVETPGFRGRATTVQNDDPEAYMREFEALPDWHNDPGVRTIFDSDMRALRESENVILLLPAGTSAHIEAGVAYGLGKRLILIGERKETESLYLIFDERYSSTRNFIEAISQR